MFYGDGGMFRVAPPLELKKLDAIFQHNVFKMLLAKRKITREMMDMLSAWKYSGLHVFCGNRISPNDEKDMENLARYIIRASIVLSGADEVPGSGGDGNLYIQRRQDNQELLGAGMAGRDVFANPEPGRADGAFLRILQQRFAEN